MKRTDYETLSMEEIVVEMEDGFLAASGDNIQTSTGAELDADLHTAGADFTDVSGNILNGSNTTWE